MARSRVVCVRLPSSAAEMIDEIARIIGRDRSFVLRTLVLFALKLLDPRTSFIEIVKPAAQLIKGFEEKGRS